MTRRGPGRRTLVWLALAATVIGVGVWIATGAPIDAGRLKGELERGVQQATGRAFTIDGPLHVTMGLAPRMTAQGISLANVDGGSQPAMLTARSLQAQVALLPLLGGRVVLEDVALDGVDILVEPGADGRLNWQFQPQRHALVPGSESSPSGGRGESLDVHRLRLHGGQVMWRFADGRGVSVALDDAVLTTPSADAAITGSGQGQVYGVPISFTVGSGSFARLQGGPVTALAGWWPLNMALTAGQATFKLVGTISHPDEGRGYQFTLTANAPDLTPLAPWLPTALALPLHDVNLTARMSDGSNGTFRTSSLSLHAGAADLSAAVPGLMLKEAVFSAPGPGQQAQLNVDGTYQGAPLRVAGTTTQPDVLAGNIPLPVTFSAEAGTATLSAHGTMPPAPNANGFDLTVDVRAPDLADLSSLARRPLPEIKNLIFGAHIGDAGFRLRGLDMRDIALQSSIGDATGNLTVAWAPVLTLNGALTSHQFDLDAAIAAWSMMSAPQTPPPAPAPATPPTTPAVPVATMIPDTPLPFASLHGADGDLSLTLDRMTLGGDAYRDVSLKMVAAGGRVVVNPLRMTAPQGILIGGLTVDASAEPPQVALTFRSPGLSAAKVSSLLGYPGGANGVLQVDAQLSSAGVSPHALAGALDGHLGLSLVNGSVSGDLLQTMLGGALSQAGVPALGGDVPVRCFAARADFSHGAGRVRTLALDTPQMAMDGDGDIDLGDETVALHLRPTVRIGGTGVAALVALTGGFGALKAVLDPVLGGGRVGISIGGPAPGADACASKLALARNGMPGPMPTVSRTPNGPSKKPIDLLRGLFH